MTTMQMAVTRNITDTASSLDLADLDAHCRFWLTFDLSVSQPELMAAVVAYCAARRGEGCTMTAVRNLAAASQRAEG